MRFQGSNLYVLVEKWQNAESFFVGLECARAQLPDLDADDWVTVITNIILLVSQTVAWYLQIHCWCVFLRCRNNQSDSMMYAA